MKRQLTLTALFLCVFAEGILIGITARKQHTNTCQSRSPQFQIPCELLPGHPGEHYGEGMWWANRIHD